MAISRRSFLKSGTLAGVSAAFLLGNFRDAFGQRQTLKEIEGPGFEVPDSARREADLLNRELFEKYRYTKFRVHLNKEKASDLDRDVVDIELIRIERDDKAAEEGIECFTLFFHGLRDAVLKQGTYKIEHDKIGTFEMFIVPNYQDMYGGDYVAVFNRVPSGRR